MSTISLSNAANRFFNRSALRVQEPLSRSRFSSDEIASESRQFTSASLRSDTLRAASSDSSSASSSRFALRFGSKTQEIVSADGDTLSRSRSSLAFQYEFTADDGSQIRVSARANLSYSQANTDEGSRTALRISTQTNIRIVQNQVADGIGEFSETAELPEEARTALAAAVSFFQDATDTIAKTYISGNTLDGDSILQGIAETFNTFANAVLEPFLIGSSDDVTTAAEAGASDVDPAALPATDDSTTAVAAGASDIDPAANPSGGETTVAADLEDSDPVTRPTRPQGNRPPRPAPPAKETGSGSTTQTEDNDEVSLPSNPLPKAEEPSPLDIAASGSGSTTEVEDEAQASDDNSEGQVIDQGGLVPTDEPTELTPAERLRQAETTLFRLRLSVIESLQTISRDFETGEVTETSFSSRLNAKIDYRSSSTSLLTGQTARLGTSFDVAQ